MSDFIPNHLRENVPKQWGDEGRQWLKDLPNVLRTVMTRWNFEAKEVLEGGRLSLVIGGEARGRDCVLKIVAPGSGHAFDHVALERWNGNGSVRLYASAPDTGATLTERARPGVLLHRQPLTPKQRFQVGIDLAERLHVTADGSDLPALADTFRLQLPDPKPTDIPQVQLARRVFDSGLEKLTHLTVDDVILHGDHHPGNTLSSSRAGQLAIDPMPSRGDAAFDYVHSVLAGIAPDEQDPGSALLNRISDASTKTGSTFDRILAWCVVRTAADFVRQYDLGQLEQFPFVRSNFEVVMAGVQKSSPAFLLSGKPDLSDHQTPDIS